MLNQILTYNLWSDSNRVSCPSLFSTVLRTCTCTCTFIHTPYRPRLAAIHNATPRLKANKTTKFVDACVTWHLDKRRLPVSLDICYFGSSSPANVRIPPTAHELGKTVRISIRHEGVFFRIEEKMRGITGAWYRRLVRRICQTRTVVISTAGDLYP